MAVFKKSNLYCLLVGTYNPFMLIEITDIFGFVIYFVFLFLFLFISFPPYLLFEENLFFPSPVFLCISSSTHAVHFLSPNASGFYP